ncbi:hypothetical protein HYW76_04580 [Candidatus Pacearchaeota archaeon]|nr:hypothetical protein [Candidatus Pacearchaeota archaeon]
MAEENKMSKEEQIGYHKGAISTLINERNEMIKIAQLTEQLIKAHIEELKKLGINIQEK